MADKKVGYDYEALEATATGTTLKNHSSDMTESHKAPGDPKTGGSSEGCGDAGSDGVSDSDFEEYWGKYTDYDSDNDYDYNQLGENYVSDNDESESNESECFESYNSDASEVSECFETESSEESDTSDESECVEAGSESDGFDGSCAHDYENILAGYDSASDYNYDYDDDD